MTNRHNNSAEIRAKTRNSKASFIFGGAQAAATDRAGRVTGELGLEEFATGARAGHDVDRPSWN